MKTSMENIFKYLLLFLIYLSFCNTYAQTTKGDLKVYVQNIDGTGVTGAKIKRYNKDWKLIDSTFSDKNGTATWTSIATGVYNVEAYYNGNKLPFKEEEFWGNSSGEVKSNTRADVTIKRYEPVVDKIVFKNNSTNEIINPTNPIQPNVTVRAEVTVKNMATVDRLVKVELLIDRDKASKYDYDLAFESKNIIKGSSVIFSKTFIPSEEGLYYVGIKIETYVETKYVITDTWTWSPTDGVFKVDTPKGDLKVFVQNVDGTGITGAKIKRYNKDWKLIDSTYSDNGTATWTSIATGVYNVEAYYNGNKLPFKEEEFWGNSSGEVKSNTKADVTIKRYEPVVDKIVFKNNSTNEIINPTNPIQPNVTVRAEVTVKNMATVDRLVKIELLIDRDKASKYDHDLAFESKNLIKGSSVIFSKTFIPSEEGLYYVGIKIETYVETKYVITDTWTWSPTGGVFKINPSQSWELKWSDEFNGTTIDASKWTYDIGANDTAKKLVLWGNNEKQYYTDRIENSRIENGNLVIRAIKEIYKGNKYTSARLKTEKKKAFTYGKIEAKIKISSGKGLLPAFWMLGNNNSAVGYPKCGEIDIMEHPGNDPNIFGTMHWIDAKNDTMKSSSMAPLIDDTQYHIYSIIWDKDSIKWFLDGSKYGAKDISNKLDSKDELHLPFFIILNIAVGADWAGNPVDDTKFPSLMYVDYVRVYESVTSDVMRKFQAEMKSFV